jgi:class 3 adenylate cyclase
VRRCRRRPLQDMLGDIRTGLRRELRWFDRQPGLVAVVQAARQIIPGDSSFGDPMSTGGASPAHILARRAWTLSGGRWSLLAEVTLAWLQVADWLGEDVRGVASDEELPILFLDLRGFSQWALTAGDANTAELLRSTDAVITDIVEAREGVVVKRLGDGAMAIFSDCDSAIEAAFEAISECARSPSTATGHGSAAACTWAAAAHRQRLRRRGREHRRAAVRGRSRRRRPHLGCRARTRRS